MNKTKKITFIIILAMIFCFYACQNDLTQEPNEQHNESAVTFEEQLNALPNVESVTKISMSDLRRKLQEEQPEYYEKLKDMLYNGDLYIVYFNSLLDPDNSSDSTTFKQKALIGFIGNDKPNCLVSTGYYLKEAAFMIPTENEIAFLLNCNFIAVEHRYFGDSLPIGIHREDGNYDGTYWRYLNTKNAARDVHEIVSQLKTLLTGKWAVTGASKGGLTANLYCYYYPEDVDLTVPYVAPLCNGPADLRLKEAIYTNIGDDDIRYQNGLAKKYRDMFLDIQLWLLERRNDIYADGKTYQQKLWNDGSSDVINPKATEEIVYDISVLEIEGYVWQYGSPDTFKEIWEFYQLENDDDTTNDMNGKSWTKKDYFYKILNGDSANVDDITPYLVQSLMELGNYSCDSKYLRDAIKQKKL
ncbi:MAG: hypothetical protein J6W76_02065, partial [Spirochaetales bacterium]|nr:hypothetical protein [Spirochaetales bacterium]